MIIHCCSSFLILFVVNGLVAGFLFYERCYESWGWTNRSRSGSRSRSTQSHDQEQFWQAKRRGREVGHLGGRTVPDMNSSVDIKDIHLKRFLIAKARATSSSCFVAQVMAAECAIAVCKWKELCTFQANTYVVSRSSSNVVQTC